MAATKGTNRWPWIIAILLVLIAIAALVYYVGIHSPKSIPPQTGQSQPGQSGGQSTGQQPASGEEQSPASATGAINAPGVPQSLPQGNVVRVETGEDSADQSAEGASATGSSPQASSGSGTASTDQIMEERKKPFGIRKSVDAVVRTDESIEIGGVVVPIAELERKMVVEQRGEVLEKPLGRPAQVSAWGVYVVRQGDNLWDIHLHLLSEFLQSKGVTLQKGADLPKPSGRSTGVGKVLKFAENMVGVYNLKTGKMHKNLDLIEPGEKVVIYNLSEIFEMLSKIDPNDLSGVEFDGRILYFPQKQQGIEMPAKDS